LSQALSALPHPRQPDQSPETQELPDFDRNQEDFDPWHLLRAKIAPIMTSNSLPAESAVLFPAIAVLHHFSNLLDLAVCPSNNQNDLFGICSRDA